MKNTSYFRYYKQDLDDIFCVSKTTVFNYLCYIRRDLPLPQGFGDQLDFASWLLHSHMKPCVDCRRDLSTFPNTSLDPSMFFPVMFLRGEKKIFDRSASSCLVIWYLFPKHTNYKPSNTSSWERNNNSFWAQSRILPYSPSNIFQELVDW